MFLLFSASIERWSVHNTRACLQLVFAGPAALKVKGVCRRGWDWEVSFHVLVEVSL